MATWVGAIVETRGRADFAEVAAKYRITLAQAPGPWLLVECANLRLAVFAQALSRELGGAVIAFLLQTTASVEEVEHWHNGELMRKFAYSADEGGWLSQQGRQQAWESVYFFAEDETTADDAKWPLNLADELTPEDIARYEQARAARDASSVMDLLSGGSAHSLLRLCHHFGVDPQEPGARYTAPPNWRLRIVVALALLLLAGLAALVASGK
jgi:hypothetical protein